MPKLISKVEGRGNGIKTCIPNMVDIAKALARPASYTTKYFGCELGAQTTFNEDSGRAIVNGAHTAQVLSGLLEGFINRFVQCGSCKNPETVMSVSPRAGPVLGLTTEPMMRAAPEKPNTKPSLVYC